MKPALVALLALALSACGFHPRTHTVLPIKLGPTRVVVPDNFSPLGEELARALDRAGVPAADENAASGTVSVLRITREVWDTQPVAVDQFARAREYVTRYNVDFVLQGPDGKPMLTPQKLEQSREYSYDANAAAGSPAEQELIRRELRREMEAAILRRIEYALRTQP
ncbi:MAG: LPS assembly lipoprotein LptE [Arenimonas sp.]